MNRQRCSKFALVFLGAAMAFAPVTCPASIVVWMRETGGNVVFSLSGSFDTSGLTPTAATAFSGGGSVYPDAGGHGDINFNSSSVNIEEWSATTIPSFGFTTPGFQFATTNTGDTVVFNSAGFSLDQNYVSGSPLTAEMTFASTTFSAMGITAGTYVANLPNSQTYTLTSVPEPSTYAMLLGGLGCGAAVFARRRRRGVSTR